MPNINNNQEDLYPGDNKIRNLKKSIKDQNSLTILQKDLFSGYIDKFLDVFKNFKDLKKPIFEIESRPKKKKVIPNFMIATPEDAKEIMDICLEAYEGTYPYKEFESIDLIVKLITHFYEDPEKKVRFNDHIFILFKDEGNIMGFIKCTFEFEEKKGYMGSLMIKEKYQGIIDIVKANISSYAWMWSKYEDRLSLWYCENRTGHTTSQYLTSICGVKTIGILPNKDLFFGKIESDVFGIIYRKETLSNLRPKKIPSLIPDVEKCFSYSNKKFNLGLANFFNPEFSLSNHKLESLKFSLKNKIETEYGYKKTITLYIDGLNSYFTFIHNLTIPNFERAEYKVNNLEELFIFVSEFMRLIKEFNIRYTEVFVSAYYPSHQKIFFDQGFKARGYIPCWKYNPNLKCFEDYIIFNKYIGKIEQIFLLPEGLELFKSLGL